MPKFLPSDLAKRIKEKALDEALKRINVEFGDKAPPARTTTPGTLPTADDFAPASEPELPQSFVDKIKTRVRDKVLNLSPAQQRLLDPHKSLDLPTIKYRLKYAASHRLLVLMQYNGQYRMVESYSYRMNGKPLTPGGPPTLRFYGLCALHNKIHSFDLNKIQSLVVPDNTYTPRWTVEI